jgi:hypothetical protein
MTELSPAAQAVRDAAEKQTDLDLRYAPQIAAAALRAAADQLGQDLEFYNTRMIAARDLLAIADELEAQ